MLTLRNCEPCTALDIKGAGNKMTVDDGIFWAKILNKCEKVNFLQIGHFVIAAMVEACSKTGLNKQLTAPSKP